jgi:preprotein translocase subunit SecE
MSLIKSEDSGKWINALVALVSVVTGFLFKKLIDQLALWFDLEAKVSSIQYLAQGAGVVLGFSLFIYILKNEKTASYLAEVYDELVKVVWPSKDATLKITVGLAIALVILASIFVGVDFIFKNVLSYLY